MRLPLIGGSYSSRSIIASSQRCINYYPELNPKDSLVPVTHYQRPGLVPLVQADAQKVVRCLYRASNDTGFCCIGSNIYSIDSNFNLTLLGSITPAKTTPVSMIDNGVDLMIVDGSPNGWTVPLANPTAITLIVDPLGFFTGADRLDFIDTFIIWNIPGTKQFGSTLSQQITPFDALYFGEKTNYPDLLQTLIVNRHEILLMGGLKSEIWYDAGNALFPFAELPGAYIEHGIEAKYSLAAQDISVYWLARNFQGSGMVMRQRGYYTQRISNHAVEFAIRQMARTVGISDAIGYIYQEDGHVWYVLHFPAGDQTWVYDEAIGDPMNAWHQEAWTDQDGVLHRHRGNCAAFLYGKNVCGDWENGTIYEMSMESYVDIMFRGTDKVEGPITFVRSFPHIGGARDARGQLVQVDGKRLQFSAFTADIECGLGPTGIDHLPARISLRWSDDRGRTFGNDVLQSSGHPGEYLTQPLWRGLGIARDRIFELSHSIAGPAALNGAWVEAEILGT